MKLKPLEFPPYLPNFGGKSPKHPIEAIDIDNERLLEKLIKRSKNE